jgi:hypothetical protein
MITMNKWTFFMLLVLFTSGCRAGKNARSGNSDPGKMAAEKIYSYSDGSGNRYLFSKNSFEYFPVKPAESSTGHYDGGDPVKNQPDPGLFAKVTGLIHAAAEAKTDHTPDRAKGTAKIEITEGVVSTMFILKMNSTWRSDIEAVLTKMKTAK